jgi:hypothetical protein
MLPPVVDLFSETIQAVAEDGTSYDTCAMILIDGVG